MEEARHKLAETFNDLAGKALKGSNEEFLKLARRELEKLQGESKADLEGRKVAVENLVKPIREALDKTEHQIREIEKTRIEAYGSLSRHLESMAQVQQALQSETRNLVQALRRPEVRGQWGEITLRRLAELAGMVEHCDFFEQEHVAGEEGRFRPDMVVRMPGGREIVVDVKTPLDAYISAVEAPDDAGRAQHLQRHARKVKDRIKELASKAYWNQFKKSPDFVVLFIPGDQFLAAALDVDHGLLEEALQQKVVLATPTSLVALLRAIAYGWRQQALAENAEKIRDLGDELYKRLATFSEHLAKLGKSLDSSVKHYNSAVGSYERSLMPGARKFTEMGVSAKKEVSELEPVESGIRELAIGDGSGEAET